MRFAVPGARSSPEPRRKPTNHAKQIAESAVTRAGQVLKDRSVDGIHAHVTGVFWYGAVHINPKHCVVWVILRGAESEAIPPWYFGGGPLNPVSGDSPPLKQETIACLERMADEIQRLFREESWAWEKPRIGFESDERVQRGGGWHYFK